MQQVAPRPLLLSRRATPDGSARCLLPLYCAAPLLLFVLHMAPVWIDGCIIRISTDIKYLALFVLHMAPVWIDGCIIRISIPI